ncbi:MAG: hypothetical protein Q7R78_02585 [bacterium]|nr:hypothetical protein [bacterium]
MNDENHESPMFDKNGFIFCIKFILVLIILFFAVKFGSEYFTLLKIEVNNKNLVQNNTVNTSVATSTIYIVPKFEPSALSWSLATSSAEWKARDSAVSFVFKDKIWTMGGLNGNKNVNSEHYVKYWEAPHFNDIWNSDDGVSWKLVNPKASWSPRRSMSVVFFHDKLWMLGGWSTKYGYTSDIWQSEDGINWRKVVSSAEWPAREGQVVEVFQDKIWLMGGVNYDKREAKNDIWYSDNGLKWYKATTTVPWGPRWDHDIEIFKDKIFLVGGMNLSGTTFRDVWSSADGINWELVTNNPSWSARQGHALVSYKNNLWIIGRLDDDKDGGINDIWYSEDGKNWKRTNTNPEWIGREDHSVLEFKDKLYVFGGMGSNWTWLNDVWVSQ